MHKAHIKPCVAGGDNAFCCFVALSHRDCVCSGQLSVETPGLHANRKVKEEGIERRPGLEGARRPAGTTLLRVASQVPAHAYGWYWDRAPVQKQSEQGRQSSE